MDCRTARLLLDFQRPDPGELPPEDLAALEQHLAGCADCDAAGRAERRLDDTLRPAMRDVPVPDGLKDRLLGRLREDRGRVLRRRLAWAARGVAVAATLLIGVGLWWHYHTVPLPELDIAQIGQREAEQSDIRSPEQAQEWFQTHHKFAMTAPVEFDYSRLIYCRMVDVQGKPVPKLIFSAPDGTRASVYVVRRDQFNIDDLSQEKFETFNQKLVISPPKPERPDTAYVIFWDGADLESVRVAVDQH